MKKLSEISTLMAVFRLDVPNNTNKANNDVKEHALVTK